MKIPFFDLKPFCLFLLAEPEEGRFVHNRANGKIFNFFGIHNFILGRKIGTWCSSMWKFDAGYTDSIQRIFSSGLPLCPWVSIMHLLFQCWTTLMLRPLHNTNSSSRYPKTKQLMQILLDRRFRQKVDKMLKLVFCGFISVFAAFGYGVTVFIFG